MFTKYITGEENSNGVKINKTPWNDDMLNKETGLIAEHLAKVQGDPLRMTVSSQRKKGMPSSKNILRHSFAFKI